MSTNSVADSRRVAKNTVILYCRMFFLMFISLFTSRVVLNTLGVTNFGVYNVVGGLVSMFSILSTSITNSISRFLTYEIGRGTTDRLNRVFCTSVNVMFFLCFVVVLAIEVIGIWFLNHKMDIPSDRMSAAHWVLQCSTLTFCFGLLSTPYNAAIVAHEKMSAFAYISILEAALRLVVVYMLYISSFDKLKTYAVLLLVVSILIRFIYASYSKRHFKECTYHLVHDRSLLKDMLGFAGWSFFGNTAWILNTQGVNMLINVFFGVTLNAARGIATQVEGAVMRFVDGFMTSLNPQITKTYAAGELGEMHKLICRGAKFSFFLVLFFALPICLETKLILTLWLKIVPDYSVAFVRLTFISTVCTLLGNTLVTAQYATGKIRKYQIVITICGLWVFPLTWLAFHFGLSPMYAYIIYAVVYFILIFVRIYLVKDLIHLPWQTYIKEVVLKTLFITCVSASLPFLVYGFMAESILRLIFVVLLSWISVVLSVYTLGVNSSEREYLMNIVRKHILRHHG